MTGARQSIPMQPISINITKDVHAELDDFGKPDYDVESGVGVNKLDE